MTTRKSKSPYQRYGKSPIRYSAEYYAWRTAAKKHVNGGSRADMDAAGRIHSAKFGPRAARVEAEAA
jgi:hypothetical protein